MKLVVNPPTPWPNWQAPVSTRKTKTRPTGESNGGYGLRAGAEVSGDDDQPSATVKLRPPRRPGPAAATADPPALRQRRTMAWFRRGGASSKRTRVSAPCDGAVSEVPVAPFTPPPSLHPDPFAPLSPPQLRSDDQHSNDFPPRDVAATTVSCSAPASTTRRPACRTSTTMTHGRTDGNRTATWSGPTCPPSPTATSATSS